MQAIRRSATENETARFDPRNSLDTLILERRQKPLHRRAQTRRVTE
jgi:hypothetical protein